MIALRFPVPKIALALQTSTTAAFLLTGIATGALAQTSVALSPSPPTKDVFERLDDGPNVLFRGEPVRLGTIAVVDLRRIILQRDDEPDWTRTYITPIAEQYTNIGGVPFGAYLLTFCAPDFRRSEATIYRRRIAEVLGKIDVSLIPTSDRPRQRQILEASDQMLARIEAGVDVPRDELDAFARRLAPLIRANIDAVAADLKTSLDAATTQMRRILKPGEWEQLRVAIIDSDIPYAAQVQYSYFKQLMGPGAENRLRFARGSISIAGGVTAIFSTLTQSPASRAFFGDLSSGRAP
jgi:hypothetical protein